MSWRNWSPTFSRSPASSSHLGANVIGTVGSEAKAAIARELGCDHVIDYSTEDFAARCRALTDGAGVHVVYESIGKATLTKSLDSLRPLGMCAAYGHASGPPDPVDIIRDLGARGSLFVTRPAIMHYLATRAALEEAPQARQIRHLFSSGKGRTLSKAE